MKYIIAFAVLIAAHWFSPAPGLLCIWLLLGLGQVFFFPSDKYFPIRIAMTEVFIGLFLWVVFWKGNERLCFLFKNFSIAPYIGILIAIIINAITSYLISSLPIAFLSRIKKPNL